MKAKRKSKSNLRREFTDKKQGLQYPEALELIDEQCDKLV